MPVCVCVGSVIQDLVLIPVHTKPQDSDKELDQLYDVFLHMKAKWKTDVSFYLASIIKWPGCVLLECFCVEHDVLIKM